MSRKQQFSFDQIDIYSLLADILRNLWLIILGALSFSMAMYVYQGSRHINQYTSTTTFAIMSRKSSDYVANNLNAAKSTAQTFSGIINSDVLKAQICKDLNMGSFNASVRTTMVSETNILIMYVTSPSPEVSYIISRAIINDYPTLTSWASSTMIMNILKDPEIATRPDNPLYLRGAALRNFILSFAVLLAVFAYLSVNRETIKKEKDITDKLDARSLGTIQFEKKYKLPFMRFREKKNSLLVTDITASFGFVESYRKIVTKIIAEAEKRNGKVILVTSVREHEGKSTFSSNVALTLAQQGKQVVLIDGDLRSPSISEIFNIDVSANKSVHALLSRQNTPAKALYTDQKSGLYMLLNDRNYANSTEIISSAEMKQMVKIFKEAADYVIIDSPPVSILADAIAEANLADISILVVQYNRVLAQDVNDTIDILNECRANLIGCVLNGVKTVSSATAGYGYGGYGRYGRYGKYGAYGKYGKYKSYGYYAQKTREEESA